MAIKNTALLYVSMYIPVEYSNFLRSQKMRDQASRYPHLVDRSGNYLEEEKKLIARCEEEVKCSLACQ